MSQKSYASNLNNLTGVCCYAYSFLEHVNLQAHLYHRPQNTAIACPLVTNGKTNGRLLGTLDPAKGEQWLYCVTVQKKLLE